MGWRCLPLSHKKEAMILYAFNSKGTYFLVMGLPSTANIFCLKNILHQGILKPVIYGGLDYKFKKNRSKAYF